MSTATTQPSTTAPPPFEVPGPVTRVPSLEELERLTEVPDRRVVFRGVDWSFYDRLVDSIPEGSNIHVDYDGKDLEVMGNGPNHEDVADALGDVVKVVAVEMGVPCKSLRETTWKRIIIERLTPAGTYVAMEASGFLPVRADEIQRWIVDEDRTDDADWFRRMQAYFKTQAAKRSRPTENNT